MLRRSQEYSNLRSSSEKDEEDCLEGSEERQNDRTISCYLHRWHSTLQKSLICIYGGWILSAWLLVVFITSSWINHGYDDRKCFDSTASYSPITKELPPKLMEFRFNGSIRWPSPYRGPPSPEIDRAWNDISIVRPLNIKVSSEEFLDIGTDPETAARNDPEFGGSFFMVPEFTHQLHCVNLLRKVSHFKFEYYKKVDPDFNDKTETFKVHIDHCVEMLRQFVMCHADAGVVTAHWIEQRNRPWPDFNTKHVCRDFNGLLDWIREHQLPEGAPYMPLKPAGAKALQSPP